MYFQARLNGNRVPQRHPKVLVHIECLRGTGELTLASRVAEALSEKGVDVVIASGEPRSFFNEHDRSPDDTLGSLTIRRLPTIRYDDKHKKAYLTQDGEPLSAEGLNERATKLRQIIAEEKPDAMMVCYWPFGNGQGILDTELGTLIPYLKRNRPEMPIFGSIREVIHADSQAYMADKTQAAAMINDNFTTLFVHGDPDFKRLDDRNFDYERHISPDKIDYTGYLFTPHPEAATFTKDAIVITSGGGDYRPSSGRLLEKAIDALDRVEPAFIEGKHVRMFVGKSFDKDEYEKLQGMVAQMKPKLARKNATLDLEHTLPLEDFQALLPHCSLFIGQAGVGTMMDVMCYRYPTVVVPIEEKDEKGEYDFREQLIRAQLMEQKKLLKLVHQADIDKHDGSALLARQMNAVMGTRHPTEAEVPIRSDGARHTAEAICAALGMDTGRNPVQRGSKMVDSLAASR